MLSTNNSVTNIIHKEALVKGFEQLFLCADTIVQIVSIINFWTCSYRVTELHSYTVTRARPPVTAVTCNWQQSSQIRKRVNQNDFRSLDHLPSIQNRRRWGYFCAKQGNESGAYLRYVSISLSADLCKKSPSERFSPDRVSKQGSKVAEIA